jgi:hypothetical protein
MRQLVDRSTGTAAGLALVAALLTGCADDDSSEGAFESPSASPTPSPSPTPPPSPSPTETDAAQKEWATCVSTRADLRVSYPADWTARDYPGGGCAYFDPEPFEVQRGTEGPAVAARLDVESVRYDRVLSAYTDGEVISQEQTEVAGRPAVRVEDRDTGGPLGDKGRRLTYIVDLGEDQTLLLTTNETDAGDPERAREVLDRMAQRLERAG